MTAVMRHVRSPQPSNLSGDPTRAEMAFVGRLITVAAGLQNARRRDREAATRKAATPSRCSCNAKEKTTMNTTTHAAQADAVPPPPDMATAIRELREFAPPDTYGLAARANAKAAERAAELASADPFAPPDTYGLRAAAKARAETTAPPPPDFAQACIALRAERITAAERKTFAPPDPWGMKGGAR